MALLKFLRRSEPSRDTPGPAATSAAAEAVQAARQQARRRLVGAVVLLGLGVIGFPLVFQTQPRPIPVDIPIEIPRKDQAPPLLNPGGAGGVQPPGASGATDLAQPSATGSAQSSAAPASAPPVEVEVLPSGSSASAPGAGKALSAGTDGARPEAEKPAVADSKAEARADAKVDNKADNKADAKDRGRFVVQAGSYTDLDAVREVRNKLERMGLKTYTQAAVVDGVTRVRVRVGPFSTRQEAQEVQNKIKAAGVATSLLQL